MKLSEAYRKLRRAIAYHPGLAAALGDIKSAILFDQLWWRNEHRPTEDGWHKISCEQITEETALTYREQRRARKVLKAHGMLEEKYVREEHAFYYRMRPEGLDTLMVAPDETSSAPEGEHMTKSKVAPYKKSCGTLQKVSSYRKKIKNKRASPAKYAGSAEEIASSAAKDAASEAAAATPEELLDIWNQLRGKLPKVLALSGDRREKCRIRIAQSNGRSFSRDFTDAILMARETPFCLGVNTRGWRLDFDFLIANETNILKVLEGKYGNEPLPKPKSQDQKRWSRYVELKETGMDKDDAYRQALEEFPLEDKRGAA